MSTMSSDHALQKGQRYNRIITAMFVVGIAAFFVGMLLDYTFAGLVVYAAACSVGVVGLLYLQFVSPVRLGDERDRRLHNRTSGTLITVVAFVGLPIIIGLYLLDAMGEFAITDWMWGAIWAFSALYLTWGAIFLWYRYRS